MVTWSHSQNDLSEGNKPILEIIQMEVNWEATFLHFKTKVGQLTKSNHCFKQEEEMELNSICVRTTATFNTSQTVALVYKSQGEAEDVAHFTEWPPSM